MCMQNKGVEFPIICDHVAVRVDHTIVVFGGTSQVVGGDINDKYHYQDYQLRHIIWIYNLYIEQWRRYRIPKWKPAQRIFQKHVEWLLKNIYIPFLDQDMIGMSYGNLPGTHMAALSGSKS